jgi:hypothetical protein
MLPMFHPIFGAKSMISSAGNLWSTKLVQGSPSRRMPWAAPRGPPAMTLSAKPDLTSLGRKEDRLLGNDRRSEPGLVETWQPTCQNLTNNQITSGINWLMLTKVLVNWK